MRQVIVYPGETGFYVVECPSLPGCISQGETKEDALKNIKEAIRAWFFAAKQKEPNSITHNKNIGSSFDDFLEEEGIAEEVEAGAIKKLISLKL